MKFRNIWVPAVGLGLMGVAYYNFRWAGVALVGGALVMYLLLQFNRAMTVMRRAANRPIGTVASAVMLNAKLHEGVNLLHVMALTRAIGELRSPKGEEPELYRWTDAGGSFVDTEFRGGKLKSWSLTRPGEATADDAPAPAVPAESP